MDRNTAAVVAPSRPDAVAQPPAVPQSVAPPTMLTDRRPYLNGLRVKELDNKAVYLIHGGVRRWIPDDATYNNLFIDDKGIIAESGVGHIPMGPAIEVGAVLARAVDTKTVYLIESGLKRWITSTAAFERYYFASKKIMDVAPVILRAITDGPDIEWGG